MEPCLKYVHLLRHIFRKLPSNESYKYLNLMIILLAFVYVGG